MSLKRKAGVKGRDQSALLAEVGLPLTGGEEGRLDAFSPTAQQRLLAAVLVACEDGGAGLTGHLVPD